MIKSSSSLVARSDVAVLFFGRPVPPVRPAGARPFVVAFAPPDVAVLVTLVVLGVTSSSPPRLPRLPPRLPPRPRPGAESARCTAKCVSGSARSKSDGSRFVDASNACCILFPAPCGRPLSWSDWAPAS